MPRIYRRVFQVFLILCALEGTAFSQTFELDDVRKAKQELVATISKRYPKKIAELIMVGISRNGVMVRVQNYQRVEKANLIFPSEISGIPVITVLIPPLMPTPPVITDFDFASRAAASLIRRLKRLRVNGDVAVSFEWNSGYKIEVSTDVKSLPDVLRIPGYYFEGILYPMVVTRTVSCGQKLMEPGGE